MKYFLLCILALLCIYIIYTLYSFSGKYQISKEIVGKAVRYDTYDSNAQEHILILGDSTAVGVGADSDETIPALLSSYTGIASVDNHAVSGAKSSDLKEQLTQARAKHYSIALLQIGANDIIRFNSIEKSVTTIAEAVSSLQDRADAVYVLTAGDVGATTLFPLPLRKIYHKRTLTHHHLAEEAIENAGGTYINLYTESVMDPFTQEPGKYLSADGLHPSALGYRLWFDELKNKL